MATARGAAPSITVYIKMAGLMDLRLLSYLNAQKTSPTTVAA